MKCPNCGANLTIDDEVCSFCGMENPYAEKHREEMRQFKTDYNRTKSQVLEKTQSHSKFVVKVMLIAIMVVINLLVLLAAANSYEVEHFILNRRISRNYDVHKTQLDRLEEDRNIIGFHVYYYENRLYYSDSFDEYNAAYNVANSYEMVYNYMMALVAEDNEDSYYSEEQRIEMLAQQIEYLYKYSKPQKYSDMTQYSAKHQEFMDAIVLQTEELIQTYLNVPEDKIAEFRELSSARRQIMIEEGLGINE